MKTLLLISMALVAAGCGTTSDGGSPCKKNADCDPGLSCVPEVALNADGYCAGGGPSQCTKQCVTDADCIKRAPVCRTACDGSKTCATR